MKNRLRIALLLLFCTTVLHAQQTGINGLVKDAQGGVIPNATVVVKLAGGASYTTKTNSDGSFSVPSLIAGEYSVTVSAAGFGTVATKLTMLVGQTPKVETVLPVASADTSVIVRSDEQAVDTTSSSIGGNITPDQEKDLPINGRNYMEFATLVPGIRLNAITSDQPLGNSNGGKFQINVDGMQVTQDSIDPSLPGEPRFSPDAISQFQIITNRFDATQGRSAGIVVNVQSKSGTDTMHGSIFSYFRSDAFNAGDPIIKAQDATNATPIAAGTLPYINPVLPLSDQQYGGTIGGPIKKGKLWYFVSYEGEHQSSGVLDGPLLPGDQTSVLPQTIGVIEYLTKLDYQASAKDHIFVRANGFHFTNNDAISSGTVDPSSVYTINRNNYTFLGDWNRTIGSKLVNDFKVAYSSYAFANVQLYNSQAITFGTVTVGTPYTDPEIIAQQVQQYRDDLFYLLGKHSIKIGGEYLHDLNSGIFRQNFNGTASACSSIVAKTVGGVAYTAAQVAKDLFPNGTTDVATWNYTNTNDATQTSINSLCALGTYTQGTGSPNVNVSQNIIGVWVQDDYKIFPRLTLNLGVRYDNNFGVFLTGLKLNNGLLTPTSNDNHEVAPRGGFNLDVFGKGKTVIRGGAGIFFADVVANQAIDAQLFNGVTSPQPSFTGTATAPLNLTNPFGGNAATRQAVQPLGPNISVPWSLQISGGVQQVLPFATILTADYVHTVVYHDWERLNSNLIQNPNNPEFNLSPATKYVAGTPVVCPNNGVTPDAVQGTLNVCEQQFTNVNQWFTPHQAGSIYDALQMGLRHSVQHGVSAALAYTYSRLKDSTEAPTYYPNKPFTNGIHDEWANGQDDQRHTLTFSGAYAIKYGLSLSGLFHFGSGNAFPTSVGTTQPTGYAPTYNRTFGLNVIPIPFGTTCPSGSTCTVVYNNPANNVLDPATGYYITKRDALYGRNIYRADVRLQEAHVFHERYKGVIGVEAFNVFNHSNYGTYNGVVTSPTYGAPQATTSIATGIPVEWRPRSMQFLARFEF